jgi:hypothetical protein
VSTKIYTAYALKRNVSLWVFCKETKAKAIKNIKAGLTQVSFLLARDAVNPDSEPYKKALANYENDDFKARMSLVHELLRKGYKASQGQWERSEFDFDVSISFFELDGRIYLIPHTESMSAATCNALNFLRKDPACEDFRYWNNTDKPSQITTREWNRRASAWNKILDNHPSNLRLVICDYYNYYLVDPHTDIALLHRKRNQSYRLKKPSK